MTELLLLLHDTVLINTTDMGIGWGVSVGENPLLVESRF